MLSDRIPCPASKLGPRPSQPLSPFQLAPGTRALDAHKGTGGLASSVPTLGPSREANWAEKAGRAREPSLRAAEGGQVFGRQRRGEKSFCKQELPGLHLSLRTGQMCTAVKGNPRLPLFFGNLSSLSYPPVPFQPSPLPWGGQRRPQSPATAPPS